MSPALPADTPTRRLESPETAKRPYGELYPQSASQHEIRLELLPRARQLLIGRIREEASWAEVNAPDRCIGIKDCHRML